MWVGELAKTRETALALVVSPSKVFDSPAPGRFFPDLALCDGDHSAYAKFGVLLLLLVYFAQKLLKLILV